MNDSIMQYWSSDQFQPREVQTQALEWIEAQSAKYIILQAPVASGKSHIAITLSNYLGGNGAGNSYVLTPQKVLQKQYDDTFMDDVAIAVYGKNNYECTSKNCSCDIGSIIKPKCNSCPYTEAVTAASNSPNIIMNYTLAFLFFSYHPNFVDKTRKLMVIDECHNLEEALIQFSTTEITRKFVEADLGLTWPVGIDTFSKFKQWAVDGNYINRIQTQIDYLDRQVKEIQNKKGRMSKADIRTIRQLFSLEEKLDQIMLIVSKRDSVLEEKYVFDSNITQFSIKPLFGKDLFHQILDSKAEKFLFMSGTVDGPGFCRDLGIPEDQAVFLSLDSPIPAANRPVAYIPTIRMNYNWTDQSNIENRKNTIKAITQIITDIHKGESGIIHTANFKIAQWATEQLKPILLKNGIAVIDHNPGDYNETMSRDEAIDVYLKSAAKGKPVVLISPSCTEGLDLKGDLGRFSIILKVPFGNLTDTWIKKRQQHSSEWYTRQALNQTMQAAGRVVRDPEDLGTTYILDISWSYLMNSTSRLIPDWWKEAYTK